MVGEAIAIISVIVGVVVWLVRVEGRVNSQEIRHCDHVRSNEREHLSHHQRHEEMRVDIAYIRDRIDRAINHPKGPV